MNGPFAEQYSVSSAKTHGLAVGARPHVLRTHRGAPGQIRDSHAGEFDRVAARQAGDADRRTRGRVAELEVLRVDRVHLIGRLSGQVRVDEHHVPEIEAGCRKRLLHVVERELHLRRRVFRHLAARQVGAKETREEQSVARHHAGRRTATSAGKPAGTMALLRDRSRNATALISTGVSVGMRCTPSTDRAGGSLGEILAPHAFHRVVFRHVVEVHLAVDDVAHRQPAASTIALDVLERLPHLPSTVGGSCAVAVACALAGDVEEVAGDDAGAVWPDGLRSGRGDDSSLCGRHRLRCGIEQRHRIDKARRQLANGRRGAVSATSSAGTNRAVRVGIIVSSSVEIMQALG